LVAHVHGLVLAVRPGDPEEHDQPAPEAELSLLRQRAFEHEPFGANREVLALALLDSVHVDAKGGPHAARQLRKASFLWHAGKRSGERRVARIGACSIPRWRT